MPTSHPDDRTIGCSFDTVVANLLPFYLAAAKGDQAVAAMTILELIKVYRPANAAEIELAGRIVGFAAAAADNLRLSMRPDLSDAKVLRYRTNAVTLDRSAEKCRAVLAEMQAQRREIEQREAQAQQAAPVPRASPQVRPAAPMDGNHPSVRPPQVATGSPPTRP